MLDLVGWTAPDLLDRIAELGCVPETRPPRFKHGVFGEGAKELRVTSDGWIVAEGRMNAKYTRIQTRVADVATVIVYPTAGADLLPIFAAEWVVVNDRAHAVILDVELAGDQPRLRAELAPYLRPLAARFLPVLPPGKERPAWFAEIAEEWAIFASLPASALPTVRDAYNAYLDATMTNFYLPRRVHAPVGDDHPAVARYKHHHYVNSPGLALIEPRAGKDWTHEFMRDWHFGPPRP